MIRRISSMFLIYYLLTWNMFESARASTVIPAIEKAPSKTRSRRGPVWQMARLLNTARPCACWSGENCILEVKLPCSPPLVLTPYSSTRDTLTANACVGALDSLLDSPNITTTDTVREAPCCMMGGGSRENLIIVSWPGEHPCPLLGHNIMCCFFRLWLVCSGKGHIEWSPIVQGRAKGGLREGAVRQQLIEPV